MNKLKVCFGIMIMVVISMLMLTSCDAKYDATGVPVDNVYYTDTTKDEYYWGGIEHRYVKICIIGLDLDTNLLSTGVSSWKVDWKSICSVDNNEIISYGKAGEPFGFPSYDIFLQLKYPFDITNDRGKKVHFNTNTVFEATGGGGGVFTGTSCEKLYISTSEKEINFRYYGKY